MKSVAVSEDLKNASSHFAFGKNWHSFAKTITDDTILDAVDGLSRLLSREDLEGASFLDIGCGSGLSMLAAKRLGAGKAGGVDIDPDSVRTAEALLAAYLPSESWTVRQKSIFDLEPRYDGFHDIVYSWGVLHHTGDMWPAIEKAAALVGPGGYLALAIYSKTPLCGLWGWEKRLYSKSPAALCAAIRLFYKTAYIAGLAATGRNPLTYIRGYRSNRGMDWHHDVHDWLGGHPYTSASPGEVKAFLERLGFSTVRSLEKPARLLGLFGTHCNEYVFRRRSGSVQHDSGIRRK